ncbi:MAG TPA: hypothetical protein VIM65_10365 [Cyclobacteriaceae bacterium]
MIVVELSVRRWIKTGLLLSMLLLASVVVHAQKQLVLLKRESVVLRLYPGDDIKYRLKGSKKIESSYINNLYDTAIITGNDTVPFYKIDKIYFRQSTFYNRVGSLFVAGGIALFLIDQINNSWVQGKKASLDGGVSRASIALVGAGLPMVLVRKKSQRPSYKYRLMMVQKGSFFYKENPKGFSSPYIPE